MSNTAPAKQVRKPKKLPFVIMCILSAIVAVLNVLLCVLVPKYYTTINSFLYKGPDADKVAAIRQASADMTQKVESEGIVMLENKNQTSGIIEAGIGKALTQRANDYSYLFGLSYRGCGEEA